VRAGFARRRIEITPQQEEQFATYLGLLQRWNQAVSLTSIRDPAEMVERHFVEPAMLRASLDAAGPVMLDVGSGAGAPGLPLAILEPGRTCLLVEANSRKAAFLREVIDAVELEHAEVLEGRLEELIADGVLEGPVHIVTSRAWTSGWGPMLGWVAPLMVPGGRALVLITEETLRAFRRNLATGTDLARNSDPEWRDATAAGWRVQRAAPLPHQTHGYAVTLELPAY
jgi:16S rRNA (guanine527-N7)-methyltransferase